jgi:hypothetical protein
MIAGRLRQQNLIDASSIRLCAGHLAHRGAMTTSGRRPGADDGRRFRASRRVRRDLWFSAGLLCLLVCVQLIRLLS